MNWEWLSKAVVDTILSILRFFFVWDKQADAPGPGPTEKKLRDKIKKDGW